MCRAFWQEGPAPATTPARHAGRSEQGIVGIRALHDCPFLDVIRCADRTGAGRPQGQAAPGRQTGDAGGIPGRNMMKLFGIVANSLAALALSMGMASAQDDYPEMKFKYAHFVASNHALALFDKRWVELVEQGSGGKIKFEIFWSGSLGGPTEIPDLVGSGAVEFGTTAMGYFPSEFPLSGVTGNMLRV